MNLRCLVKNSLRQYRCRFDHMLATVEDQQHSPMPQRRDEAGDRIAFIDRKTESQPGRAGDEKRIPERSQIDEVDQIAEFLQQPASDRYRHGRLAHPSGTDDGHKASRDQLG